MTGKGVVMLPQVQSTQGAPFLASYSSGSCWQPLACSKVTPVCRHGRIAASPLMRKLINKKKVRLPSQTCQQPPR